MQAFTLYGFSPSGNCNKVQFVADYLNLDYKWVETNSPIGETRTATFLNDINPAGQVPAAVFDDGRKLAQSNALMLYLAEASDLIPIDAFDRAQMLSWMFWEQYSHEPYLAVRRAQLKFKGKTEGDLDPSLLENGTAALALMQRHLVNQDWMVAGQMSLADLCLVAYTRFAEEGGFDLESFPDVQNWVARVLQKLNRQ